MNIRRKRTKRIYVGEVPIGGGAPVSVQSMTNTQTADVRATLSQIDRLEKMGCDIVRVAVPDWEAVEALPSLVMGSDLPIIADIHFDHRLAIASIKAGVDGLRINPGTIGDERKIKEVAHAARDMGIPIRVGVNAGSLPKRLLRKYDGPTAPALVESALEEVEMLERHGVEEIKISVKASSVTTTIEAYRLLSKKTQYPLHVGVSEAGPRWSGTIKSSLGIGILLAEGIGDTIRVSLSTDPVEEVRVGRAILQALELAPMGVEIISCPTCARTCIDVVKLANELEERLAGFRHSLKIAVMGCAVNGPGEAREADIGIAGGKTRGLLFRKGEPVAWYPKDELLDVLLNEIEAMVFRGEK
jgi:(E)-4-hydroxy-3-methylbut-2-enyl-diphosphate synthase